MPFPFQREKKEKTDISRPALWKRLFQRRVLLQICLAGIIIALISWGALLFFLKYSGRSLFPSGSAGGESVFFRKLRDYDRAAGSPAAAGPADTESFSRLLDEIEKNALGVESHLSVLKRRRDLAAGASGSAAGHSWSGNAAALAAYRVSAERAAALFPHSGPLAALAAEGMIRSAIKDNAGLVPPLPEDEAGKLAEYAAVMGEDSRLKPAALSIYVLSGALSDPAQALTVLDGEALLQAAAEHRRFRGRESLVVDAAILAVLKKNAPVALERLKPLLEQTSGGNSGAALRLGAELIYDFGDPNKAAELFARSGDDRSISRQADSLVLAGRTDAARSLWTVLTSVSSGGLPTARDIRIRSLYNLAASTGDAEEATSVLERLFALDGKHLFGAIRYTRLLPAPRAIAILEDTSMPEWEALADLELLRRRLENWPIDRIIPETWLLINRHPGAEELYRWAGYYFVFQRRYYELPPLLRAAERNGFTGSWLDLQRAFEHIRQGRFGEAEGILLAIVAVQEAEISWEIYANLGRLMEAKRAYTTALEQYETAAAHVQEKTAAAKIQLHIARCLRALGQESESLRVLEYAQTLDSGNISVRLELDRGERFR
ncbi:MAG: hypothetical protein LBU18_02600 [Treponema sp.]|jgi:tetratricopeptide (TPR) repeat protein|nr:hypothetical protein [Treponema sp.]